MLGKDNRKDDMLSMTAPSSLDLCIPSFALHYVIAVAEYIQYSGDITIVDEVYGKIKSIIEKFISMMSDGLVESVKKDGYWHFYEWADGLNGVRNNTMTDNGNKYDLVLNCLFSLALEKYMYILKKADMDIPENIGSLKNQLNSAVNLRLYDKDRGLYFNGDRAVNGFSEIGNALAVLCGAAGEKSDYICRQLTEECEMSAATTSMLPFKYDALILCDKDKYSEYILRDIDKKFAKMIDSDTTTVWETFDLEFGDAESMCHGWSAVAVYYYNILLS